MRRELEEVIHRFSADATVECYFDRPPLRSDAGSPVATCVRRAWHDVTGRLPEETGVGSWMDAAIFAEAGIPTVNSVRREPAPTKRSSGSISTLPLRVPTR